MKYTLSMILIFSITPMIFATEEYLSIPYYTPKRILNTETDCKMTPNIKVLLSIPQDRDFEKKYITEHEEILRKQCDEGVLMDVYLQNDTGIFKTTTRTHSTFPACLALPLLMGGRGMDVEIERYFLVPGSFFSIPLVFDKNFEIIKGNFALTDDYVLPGEENYPESLPPPSPRIGNIPDRTYLSKPKVRTKFENVSHLPECKPNLRLKKENPSWGFSFDSFCKNCRSSPGRARTLR